MRPRANVLTGAYVVVLLVHLVALATRHDLLAGLVELALIPLLVAYLLVGTPRRTPVVTWTVVGLACSFVGDLAGDVLLKIACFLPAMLAYGRAFWPWRRRGLLGRPGPLLAYGVVLALVVGGSASQAGALAVPVAVYGAVLATTVVLATGINRTTTLGAVLFLLSDVELALDLFVAPGLFDVGVLNGSLANALLYLPAQLLIAVGVRTHVRSGAASGLPH